MLHRPAGTGAGYSDHPWQAAAEAHRVAERLTAAQAEHDQARKEAAQAREAAARLSRQIAAHQERAALLGPQRPNRSPSDADPLCVSKLHELVEAV